MEKGFGPFLRSAPGIQSNQYEVIKLAKNIVGKLVDEINIVREIFIWVRDNIKYNPYVSFDELDDYSAEVVLKRKKGYCVQKSALLCSLLRVVGIPTRLGFADIKNYQMPFMLKRILNTEVMTYHCFVECFLKGGWVKLTPSFERKLCLKKRWFLVSFGGDNALLPQYDMFGFLHIRYIRYLGWTVGVPLERILLSWRKRYGRENINVWAKAARDGKKWSC